MSCLWVGRTCSEPPQTMPGTSNFGHFDHFSYWKGQFLSFAYQGSVKMPFWPYFDPILSPPRPKFRPLAKMCLFVPFAKMDLGGPLRDPKFDLILTILDPFEGPESRLWLGPAQSCLWAGGPAQSLSNPYPKPQILGILTTFGPPRNLDLDPFEVLGLIFWQALTSCLLACLVLLAEFIWFWVKICGSKYFDMALFDLLWSVWALHRCLFVIILRIFENIVKCCVVVLLRRSIFGAYRLFAYFTKACAQKSPYFFTFFRSIASCDHQLTSEGQLLRPFSLLFAILMFS